MVLGVSLALAGCGSDEGSGDQTTGSGGTVTLGIASPHSMTWTLHHVAVGQGHLDEQLGEVDADYDVTEFSGGGPLFAAMSAGDVDLAFVPASTVVSLNQQNRGLKCVMMLSTGGSNILVGAAKYEAERGTDIAAYDGGTWGYSAEGSAAPKINAIVLNEVGAEWANQSGIALGSTTAAGPALDSGRVDIVTVDSASAQQIVDDGTGYVVVNTNDPDDTRFPYPRAGNCIAASEEYLDEHPDLVEAVVTAELAALFEVQENVDDAAAVVELFPELDDGSAWNADEWPLVAPSFATLTGIADEQTLADTAAMTEALFDLQLPDGAADASFTNDVVDKAYDALGVDVP